MEIDEKKIKFYQCQQAGFKMFDKYLLSGKVKEISEAHAQQWMVDNNCTFEQDQDRYTAVYYSKFIELAWQEAIGVGIVLGLNAEYFDEPNVTL